MNIIAYYKISSESNPRWDKTGVDKDFDISKQVASSRAIRRLEKKLGEKAPEDLRIRHRTNEPY